MENEIEKLVDHSIVAHYPASERADVPKVREKVLQWCAEHDCLLLAGDHPDLFRLKAIADPPVLLYVRGNAALLSSVSLAVVGTRRPTPYGIRAAMLFSQELSRYGFVIVSGLASGIDSAAHDGALRAEGTTIAVLGHGLDRIYPRGNHGLAERILEAGGCLVSEYPPGVAPMPFHFPQRNRIISGLSLGTLVIEAAAKSGSLITAKTALEQGREVFAVPGGFDDPGHAGSHQLIQQGAKLVISPKDVLTELPEVYLSAATRNRNEECGEVGGAGCDELRSLFVRCGGSASLEELVSEGLVPQPNLLAQLSSATRHGRVCEIYPQQYVWVERAAHS